MAKADKLKTAGTPAGLTAATPPPPSLRAIKGGKAAPAKTTPSKTSKTSKKRS
jgi:hypothetical protein